MFLIIKSISKVIDLCWEVLAWIMPLSGDAMMDHFLLWSTWPRSSTGASFFSSLPSSCGCLIPGPARLPSSTPMPLSGVALSDWSTGLPLFRSDLPWSPFCTPGLLTDDIYPLCPRPIFLVPTGSYAAPSGWLCRGMSFFIIFENSWKSISPSPFSSPSASMSSQTPWSSSSFPCTPLSPMAALTPSRDILPAPSLSKYWKAYQRRCELIMTERLLVATSHSE